jgi:hypothetical protein
MNNTEPNWLDVLAYNNDQNNLELSDTEELCRISELNDLEEMREALDEFIARRGFDEVGDPEGHYSFEAFMAERAN